MSYAASYALFNYTLADHSKGLEEYSNLRLVRAFERGHDPKSSEAGFILTHVDMVKETGSLINGVLKVVDTLEQRGSRSEINDGFREILTTMEKIEASMEGKYTALITPTITLLVQWNTVIVLQRRIDLTIFDRNVG